MKITLQNHETRVYAQVQLTEHGHTYPIGLLTRYEVEDLVDHLLDSIKALDDWLEKQDT